MEDVRKEEVPKIDHKRQKEISGNISLYLIIGVICALLIFSVVQTFQIQEIKESAVTGNAVGTAQSGKSAAAISKPTAAAPRSAPVMVGGC